MTTPAQTSLVIPPLRRAWLRELGVPTPWMPAAEAAPVSAAPPLATAGKAVLAAAPMPAKPVPPARLEQEVAAPAQPASVARAPSVPVSPEVSSAAEPEAGPVGVATPDVTAQEATPAGNVSTNALTRWAGQALRRPVAAQGRLLAGVYEGAGRRWLVVTLAVAPVELQAFTADAGRLLDQMMRVLGARRGSEAFAAGWRQTGSDLLCEPRFWTRVESLKLDGMVWLGEPVASIVMAGWKASQPAPALRDVLLLPPLAALMASPAEAKPMAWQAMLDSLDAART